ncbi:hypothetical protein V6N12_051125 [Hibiscus sabdariffa]|uniref:Uncharacterized protein n=1 Tax=Hibiscus sabdariffa TaxID=183260 RepID=A0ABR2GEH2_9ROSI
METNGCGRGEAECVCMILGEVKCGAGPFSTLSLHASSGWRYHLVENKPCFCGLEVCQPTRTGHDVGGYMNLIARFDLDKIGLLP